MNPHYLRYIVYIYIISNITFKNGSLQNMENVTKNFATLGVKNLPCQNLGDKF